MTSVIETKNQNMSTAAIERAMEPVISWAARILAIMAMIAFFLPYGSVSCQGEKVLQVSLYDIGSGVDVDGYLPQEGDPSVFVLLILPAASLILTLFKEQIAHGAAWAIHGIFGAAVLISNGSIFRQFKEVCQDNLCVGKGEIGHSLMVMYGAVLMVLCFAGVAVRIFNQRPTALAQKEETEE